MKFAKDLKIIRGELHQGQSDACTAICDLLCKSFGSSPTIKSEFEGRAVIKEKQVGFLKAHAQKTDLWIHSLPHGNLYLTEGGESKVFLSSNGKLVYKVNDAGSVGLHEMDAIDFTIAPEFVD